MADVTQIIYVELVRLENKIGQKKKKIIPSLKTYLW